MNICDSMLQYMKKSWVPNLTDNFINLNSHSWYDICKYANHNDKKYNKTVLSNNCTRTDKIKLYPDETQREILHKWFRLSNNMYNATTLFLRNKIWEDGKLILKNISKYVNFRILRNNYLSEAKNKYCKHNINKHILDQSIARCVAMYKSSITKYKKKQIDSFRIRRIRKDKRFKTILIEGCLFSKKRNAFCVSALGDMSSEYPLKNIKKTCVLSYDKYKSTYTLNVPRECKPKEHSTRELTCGIDPGVRTFLTVYSEKDCYQIANNADFSKYHKRIDRLNQTNSS
jgi:hypothetical protein